jgi:hypothetical protein
MSTPTTLPLGPLPPVFSKMPPASLTKPEFGAAPGWMPTSAASS